MKIFLHQDDIEDVTDAAKALPQSCVTSAMSLIANLPDKVLPEAVRKLVFAELLLRNPKNERHPMGMVYALELTGEKPRANWRDHFAEAAALESWFVDLQELVRRKVADHAKTSPKLRAACMRMMEAELKGDREHRARVRGMFEALAVAWFDLDPSAHGYARTLLDGLPEDRLQPEMRAGLLTLARDCDSPVDGAVAERMVSTFPAPVGHHDADTAVGWLVVCCGIADRYVTFRGAKGSHVASQWRVLRAAVEEG